MESSRIINKYNNSPIAVPSLFWGIPESSWLVTGGQGPLVFGRAYLRLRPLFKVEEHNPHIHISVGGNHRKPWPGLPSIWYVNPTCPLYVGSLVPHSDPSPRSLATKPTSELLSDRHLDVAMRILPLPTSNSDFSQSLVISHPSIITI